MIGSLKIKETDFVATLVSTQIPIVISTLGNFGVSKTSSILSETSSYRTRKYAKKCLKRVHTERENMPSISCRICAAARLGLSSIIRNSITRCAKGKLMNEICNILTLM